MNTLLKEEKFNFVSVQDKAFIQVDKHRAYLEHAPAHIKEVFAGEAGKCQHCLNDIEGVCRFRKTCALDERLIEKCNGVVFEFPDPGIQKISDYIGLFTEFYPQKKKGFSKPQVLVTG
jgi:hypothetical protein